MGNIRDRTHVAQRLWDWEFINQAFTGGIRPSDIDGIVEKNGKFLVLEGKPLGGSIPTGQRITLEQLSRVGAFTVLVLYGEPGHPQKMKIIGHHDSPVRCNEDGVVALVKRWFMYAS